MKAGFIGYGNMGSALARGIAPVLKDWEIGVYDINPEQSKRAAAECGAAVFDSSDELGQFADILIIAIKPQYLKTTAENAGESCKGKPVISILAGTSIASIKKAFATVQVARFMPNLAAARHKAVTAVAYSSEAEEEFRKAALSAAEACGRAVVLDEHLFSSFTGLSGSGIAYVFQMIHAMALGGTKEGIPYPQSLEIALGTMEGAAELVTHSKEHPVSLLSRVISPGGTTIEGIAQLESSGLTAAIMKAVEAASARAAELEKNNT